jgi:hypothetical protein
MRRRSAIWQLLSIALVGACFGATSPPLAASVVPTFRVSPASLDFRDVAVRSVATRAITVTNTGDAPLVIGGYSVEGDGFSLFRSACPIGRTLAPAAYCDITVAFVPTAVGARGGALGLAFDDAANGRMVSIALRGVGIPTPSSTVPCGNLIPHERRPHAASR